METNEKFNFIATSTFGLEASVKRGVTRLGYTDISTKDGRVDFCAPISAIPRCNIWLRHAGRLLVKMGEFTATTFDELFEQTKALPWSEWIPEDGNFIVVGKSVKSQLFSVSDCQSIVKKAIVESMKKTYKVDWFEETGANYKVQVSILKDVATITIDSSGSGLHKRGYREAAGQAPIKETLASALVELSYWRKDRPLLDPVCGSGTIPIEAALIAKNIAPGIGREFASENWEKIPKKLWQTERANAHDGVNKSLNLEIFASDIDPFAVELAKNNARRAGVADSIRFEVKPFDQIKLSEDFGVCICNPPYGERIGENFEVRKLYKDMGRIFRANKTWSFYALTSDEEFEKLYGQKASAKRKLFNGMIKTDYYQYYGEKPPRNTEKPSAI